jgi:hypothetical protein
MRDVIKAAYLEELRFAKRQQWAVTIAAVTLIAGAYSMVQPLGPWEKHVAIRLIGVVVAVGCWLLYSLQCHLRNTRLTIDPNDRCPWWRGADVLVGMAGAMIVSGGAVCYSLLWRDGAHQSLLRMQGQVW